MARIPYPETPDPSVSRLPAPLNAFRMMSHAAALTPGAVDLGLAILGQGSLPPRVREQVIMLVAAHCRCPYEATQHVPIAVDAGVAQDQLSAIVDGRLDAAVFSYQEMTVLRAAKELLVDHTWAADTVVTLRRHHSDEEIVELALTIGYYTMLAGFMNGLEIDVDPVGGRFSSLANHR